MYCLDRGTHILGRPKGQLLATVWSESKHMVTNKQRLDDYSFIFTRIWQVPRFLPAQYFTEQIKSKWHTYAFSRVLFLTVACKVLPVSRLYDHHMFFSFTRKTQLLFLNGLKLLKWSSCAKIYRLYEKVCTLIAVEFWKCRKHALNEKKILLRREADVNTSVLILGAI